MVNTPFEMNRADFIFIRRVPEESFRPTHLGCMTCTAIYGNGVPTTGWRITLLRPVMEVRIKTKTAAIELALEQDWTLREKLEVLKQASTSLDQTIVAPRTEAVLNVLNYARETAPESV